jgi:hypothetical protein
MHFLFMDLQKNEKDNIDANDLISLKKLAAIMFNYTDAELENSLNKNILIEVHCHE